MWDIENILLTLEPVLRETVGVKGERFLARQAGRAGAVRVSPQRRGPPGHPLSRDRELWKRGQVPGAPSGPACLSHDSLAASLTGQRGRARRGCAGLRGRLPHAPSPRRLPPRAHSILLAAGGSSGAKRSDADVWWPLGHPARREEKRFVRPCCRAASWDAWSAGTEVGPVPAQPPREAPSDLTAKADGRARRENGPWMYLATPKWTRRTRKHLLSSWWRTAGS